MRDEIQLIEESLSDLKDSIVEIEEILKDREDNEYLKTEEEWEEKRDKNLSNQEKRTIYTRRKLVNDPEYSSLKLELKGLKKEYTKLDIDLRKSKRQFIRDYCQAPIPI
jgi:hypothetical protein